MLNQKMRVGSSRSSGTWTPNLTEGPCPPLMSRRSWGNWRPSTIIVVTGVGCWTRTDLQSPQSSRRCLLRVRASMPLSLKSLLEKKTFRLSILRSRGSRDRWFPPRRGLSLSLRVLRALG